MKKLISLLLTAIIVSACIFCTASAYVLYDVNGDGNVNAKDALEILKYAVKKIDRFPIER